MTSYAKKLAHEKEKVGLLAQPIIARKRATISLLEAQQAYVSVLYMGELLVAPKSMAANLVRAGFEVGDVALI